MTEARPDPLLMRLLVAVCISLHLKKNSSREKGSSSCCLSLSLTGARGCRTVALVGRIDPWPLAGDPRRDGLKQCSRQNYQTRAHVSAYHWDALSCSISFKLDICLETRPTWLLRGFKRKPLFLCSPETRNLLCK